MVETPLPLRDHSQPCEHDAGWYWEGTQARKIYQCNNAACPGGREVAINYEAAVAEYERWADHAGDDTRNLDQALADVVDAALREA